MTAPYNIQRARLPYFANSILDNVRYARFVWMWWHTSLREWKGTSWGSLHSCIFTSATFINLYHLRIWLLKLLFIPVQVHHHRAANCSQFRISWSKTLNSYWWLCLKINNSSSNKLWHKNPRQWFVDMRFPCFHDSQNSLFQASKQASYSDKYINSKEAQPVQMNAAQQCRKYALLQINISQPRYTNKKSNYIGFSCIYLEFI